MISNVWIYYTPKCLLSNFIITPRQLNIKKILQNKKKLGCNFEVNKKLARSPETHPAINIASLENFCNCFITFS